MTALHQTDETDFLEKIEEGLNAHNRDIVGAQRIAVNFVLKEGENCQGGLEACYVGRHFFIKGLHVNPEIRGQGWGMKLMRAAESKARELGCIKMFVDTMTFQAPEFYQKSGFGECARISGFYEGHDRVFFQKDIS